jgi:hypothetical protein
LELPSFLWLWRIAAWAMGFTLLAYVIQAASGFWVFNSRRNRQSYPLWLSLFHGLTGVIMVCLVLLLLAIGLVGTLGHYGSLGHSSHLAAGLVVVNLVMLSAWSATQIGLQKSWARPLHLGTNLVLLLTLVWVSITGWDVVQKYLP